jgi:hypothetical protein
LVGSVDDNSSPKVKGLRLFVGEDSMPEGEDVGDEAVDAWIADEEVEKGERGVCDQLNVLTEPDQEKVGLNKPRTGALIPVVTFRVIQKWSRMRTERKVRMLERVRRAFRTIGRLDGLKGWPTSASEERMGRKEKEEEIVNYSACERDEHKRTGRSERESQGERRTKTEEDLLKNSVES